MREPKDYDGAAKNWQRIAADWRAVRQAWKWEKADQPGWTHEYMQRMRTMCRVGPVLSAHILGILYPAIVVGLCWTIIYLELIHHG